MLIKYQIEMDKFITRAPTWKTVNYSKTGCSTQQQKPVKFTSSASKTFAPTLVPALVKKPLQEKSQLSSQERRLSIRDERLLKLFSSQPDEPLLVPPPNTDSGLSSSASSASSHSFQDGFGRCDENARPFQNYSSTVNDYVSSELLTEQQQPPQGIIPFPIDEALYLNLEEQRPYTPTTSQQSPQPSTPKCNPIMARIQRDLNSPSATVRLRAMKAIKSPTKSTYNTFDVPHAEQSIIFAEDRRTPPPAPTIEELMHDIIVYVEVRTGEDNRSAGVKQVISALGARVNDKLLRDTTHVIFKDGLLSTYKKAKQLNIPVVSILWIEACKNQRKICDPKDFPISNVDRYENPELYEKMKRHKSMQPDSECNKRVRAKHGTPKDSTPKTAAASGNIKKTSTLIGGTPKSSTSAAQKQSDISQFFKNLGSNKKQHKINNEVDLIGDSPATQLLNRMNSNCYTPVVKITAKKTTNRVNSNKEQLWENDKSKDAQCYSSGVGSTPKPTDAKKTLHFLAPQVDETIVTTTTPTTRRVSLRRRSCLQSNLETTTNLIGEMSLSQTTLQSNVATVVAPSTPSRTRRRNSVHVVTNMSLTTTTINATTTPGRGVRNKQTQNNDFTAIAEEETTMTTTSAQQQTNKKCSTKRITNRRTTFTTKTLEMSEVVEAEENQNKQQSKAKSPIARKQRRRTLFTPQKMDLHSRTLDTPKPTVTMAGTNKNPQEIQHSLCETPVAVASSTHLNNDSDTTPKIMAGTLLDQHAAAPLVFSSTRQPGRRRTLFDVSMDIITQRLQNINQSARRSIAPAASDLEVRRNSTDVETPMLNKSLTMPNLPARMSMTTTAARKENENDDKVAAAVTTPIAAPKKRKLFMPNDSVLALTPTPITPITAPPVSAAKRRKTLMPLVMSETKLDVCATTSTAANKKSVRAPRRSTMDFEAVQKVKKSLTATKATMKNVGASGDLIAAVNTSTLDVDTAVSKPNKKLPFLVYTNMHRQQVEVIREALDKLGGFELQDNVSSDTTHVISLEPRRTLNLLRALAHGLWILEYSWIIDSMRAGNWLSEEPYELRDFSRAVEICRAERQAFGSSYRCELFSSLGPFYISTRCGPISKDDLKQLITICGGRTVEQRQRAKYILGDANKAQEEKIYITPFWILDSITQMQLLKFYKYSCPLPVIATPPKAVPYQTQPRVQMALQRERNEILQSQI